jgi:hypothetical protein
MKFPEEIVTLRIMSDQIRQHNSHGFDGLRSIRQRNDPDRFAPPGAPSSSVLRQVLRIT